MALPEHDSIAIPVRILQDADVPAAPSGSTYRYSPATAVLVAGLMLGAAAALIAVGRVQDNPLATWCGAVALGGLWLYHKVILARFRPTNWLVRVAEHGVYIKFRSYLNHHLASGDPTVIYVPFRAMKLTRIVRESQAVPDSDMRGTTTRRRTLVEIELDDDAPQVREALAAERAAQPPKVARWYGRSAGKYRHHPVIMVAPRTISIEWAVVPRVSEFLRIMALHTPVASAKRMTDYTVLGQVAKDEQETRLIELVERGYIMDAVRLARRLYGYDVAEAKSFVDGLSTRARA